MRTYIYVDGFNLYYGAVKHTRYKWLDLKAVFKVILHKKHKIEKIKYFTAKVSGRWNPQQPIRQAVYLNALQSYIPEIEITYGHFMFKNRSGKPVNRQYGSNFVKVSLPEEKGSDVNMAVHMVNDAWKDVYDCAVVVSNDSDLAEAMRIVKEERNKKVGVINPSPLPPSMKLQPFANFSRSINVSTLRKCQLPDPIPGTRIHKPAVW